MRKIEIQLMDLVHQYKALAKAIADEPQQRGLKL